MSKCVFHVERDRKDVCAIKNEEVSYDHYKDYCRCDDHKCPVYQWWQKNK